jgi:hypothetical protein
MAIHRRNYATCAGGGGTIFFSASVFAQSLGPIVSREAIAISVFLGAIVGVFGAAFAVKTSRLLLNSLIASFLLLPALMIPMYAGIALVAAPLLTVSFMISLSLVYGFVRLALHLFARPRQ